MEAEKVYCLCRQPNDIKRNMIECDFCEDWFHPSCVGLQELQIHDLEKYHCPNCAAVRGASLYRQRTNWHRLDYWEVDAEQKPCQTGTAVFIRELKTRHFPSSDGLVKHAQGHQLTVSYLKTNGFDVPILIKDKSGLEMDVPPDTFTVDDVEVYLGPNFILDVIDVARQVNILMKLSAFSNYFRSLNRVTTLNVISLEFSETSMAPLVTVPRIVRELDWVNYVWPENMPDDVKRPSVQKYCLMSMKDSFTDFHIDFGGSSVWYHVLWGEKVFYLIRPTPANLSLYQRWMDSAKASEGFFGDQVDLCYKCVIQKGETMLIPTGWIHAVFTPIDSLVFGGNFLHSLNIPLQLQVYEFEKKIRSPPKFLFPMFEEINWYTGVKLLEELKTLNLVGQHPPQVLLVGIKALVVTLKQWNHDNETNKRKHEIPESIEGYKLCKEISKEVRIAERFLNLLNPPKPERESKRKKKKPVNKDFVDYSHPEPDMHIETKCPLKLTIKTIRPPAPSSPVISRPPLKLTLPKPATYPYTTQPGTPDCWKAQTSLETTGYSTDNVSDSSPVLAENRDKTRRPWTVVSVKQPLNAGGEENSTLKSADGSENSNYKKNVLRLKLRPQSDTEKGESVYDFHDSEEDDNCLMIDDTPTRKRKTSFPSVSGSNKIKSPTVYMTNGRDTDGDMDVAGEVDVISDLPKNGIEELLKASCYTRESSERSPRLEELNSGRASSPSTRDAVVGMLMIKQGAVKRGDQSSRSRRKRAMLSDDDGENMDKVHQDDEYVYPGLDLSDDESIFKPRGKKKLDEAWNPKARVGPLLPKVDRPMREGTKKQSVEKGLEAAALKRAGLPPAKRPYNRKKVKPVPPPLPPVVIVEEPQPGPSTYITPSSASKKVDLKNSNPIRKPKKGMATVKQRLGKILKIHKMKF